jgi:low temperature requirement protein LtrA
VMSAALPDAFGDRGLYFAGAYVVMQVGRNVFAAFAQADDQGLRRNLQRVTAWSMLSGVPWLAGGLVHGSARTGLWVLAVAVDYAAPWVRYATPGLGRSTTADWTIAGDHLAERCQLLLIVALGESILVTGSTFSDLDWSAASTAALVVAFAASVALWWLYFDRSAERGTTVITETDDPGRLGRSAYTFCHLPMVAGIVVTAVGQELTVAHPTGEPHAATALVVLGGPALFLLGHLLFKVAVFERLSLSRLAAIGGLVILLPVALQVAPLVTAAAAAAILALVSVGDLYLYRTAA